MITKKNIYLNCFSDINNLYVLKLHLFCICLFFIILFITNTFFCDFKKTYNKIIKVIYEANVQERIELHSNYKIINLTQLKNEIEGSVVGFKIMFCSLFSFFIFNNYKLLYILIQFINNYYCFIN